MNLLDIDFENLKKPIIDAFTFVYGEKYRDVVRKQINNTCFIYYFDVDGIYSYINYLRGCKDKELSLRFLDKIGVSTRYDRSNYTPYFDDATLQVLDNTIDCAFAFSKRGCKTERTRCERVFYRGPNRYLHRSVAGVSIR